LNRSTVSYELAHCIICGHTDAALIADADDLRREMEILWEYHQKRLRPDTPPARLMDRVAFSERPPFRLVRCRECGLVYRNPVERQHELAEIYERDAPTPDALRALHDAQRPAFARQARDIRDTLGRVGTGLEVGSYVGAFLAAARDEGLRFEGVDVNAAVNAFVRSLGFEAHDGDLTAFAATNGARSYDAITIWNTLDQLGDPRGTLGAAWKLLSPAGLLALRVPNGEFYASRRAALERGNPARRAAVRATLAQNNLLTFPYRWGFTPSSLSRLLESTGFEPVRVRGDVLVPTADEWTRPWARLEESLIKPLLRGAARITTTWAPWFELYARRRETPLPPAPAGDR
jgi:hypothetical protein